MHLGRRAPVALLLCLALGILGMPAGLLAAKAAPAPAAPPTTAQLVAAAAAAQAPPASPTLETPPGGFHGKKLAKELVALRTPASRTYVTDQGTQATIYWSAPIESQDATGAWHLIDPSLQPTLGGGWHDASDSASLQLPAALGPAPVTVTTPSSTVSFSLVGAAAPGTVSGTTVTYPEALPGVDVSYQSRPGALKESLTLSGPASQRQFSYAASATGGVSLRPAAPGVIDVVDGAGSVVLSFSAPSMTDAAGATSSGVAFTASQQGGGWLLNLIPDPAWLDAPGRVWPVSVDPNTTYSEGGSSDTYISSTNQTTSFGSATTFKVGHVAATGENDRALLQFPDLAGSHTPDITVLDAELSINQSAHSSSNTTTISAYPATKAWTASATWLTYDGTHSWTTAGGDFSTPATDSATGGGSNPAGWSFFNLRAAVQPWFNFTPGTTGVLLKADESVDNQLSFDSWDSTGTVPSLYVEYTHSAGQAPGQTFLSHAVDDQEQVEVNRDGNLVVAAKDYSVAGVGLGFAVQRVYNSETAPAGEHSDTGATGWSMGTGRDVQIWDYKDDGVDRAVDFMGPGGVAELFVPSTTTRCPQYPSDANRYLYTSPAGADADLCYNSATDSYTVILHASQETLTLQPKVPGVSQEYTLVSDADRNANTVSYSYDTSGHWSGATDSVGRTFTVTDNSANEVSSIAESNFTGGHDSSGNPTHRSVSYGYDASNTYLTSFTDATGAVTSYHYNGSGLIDKITDPVGNQITVSYDGWNRVSAMTYVTNTGAGTGSTTNFTYLRHEVPRTEWAH